MTLFPYFCKNNDAVFKHLLVKYVSLQSIPWYPVVILCHTWQWYAVFCGVILIAKAREKMAVFRNYIQHFIYNLKIRTGR